MLVISLTSSCVAVRTSGPSAKELYKRGRKYEKKGDLANAYALYSQAAAADPAKTEYWQRAQALQRKALTKANVATKPAPAPEPPAAAPPDGPSSDDLDEARRPQPPVELSSSPETRDFDLKADGKSLWEQVAKAYGLEVVFDGDYQAGPVQTFRLSGAGYREALHALMSATASFIVPVTSRVFMVVKDTEPKRREVENTVAISIPIPDPVTIQEAQELGRAVQQLMEIQRFAIDSANRIVIFRDRVSKARPAQLVFQQLLSLRTQVAIEVDLIAAGRSSTTALGLTVPTSFSITPIIKTIALSGGPLSFALGIADLHVLAKATKTDATTLYQALVRSSDGQQAQLHVGQKYPITTLTYIGEVPEGREVNTPPPTINFEDLGLVLKLTPRVHDTRELSLDIEAEFKLLGAGSLNGIPVISNRHFSTRARLQFNQAAVISGLVARNDFKTLSGPAGLLNIPVLGTLLGQSNVTRDDIQLLLVMKPRLLSSPPTEIITREIWVGSESRPRTPL
jgi:hypothetical protein